MIGWMDECTYSTHQYTRKLVRDLGNKWQNEIMHDQVEQFCFKMVGCLDGEIFIWIWPKSSRMRFCLIKLSSFASKDGWLIV